MILKKLLLAIGLLLAPLTAHAAVAVMSTQSQGGQPIPSLSNIGGTATYTAGSSAAVLDSSITLTCSCVTVTGGTVSIASGLIALDTLNFTNQNSITGSYDTGTGILTLSGTDTLAHYVTALQSITYSSTAVDPTNSGGDPTRSITWQVVNGIYASGTSTSDVAVQISAIPTVNNANNTVGYTALGSAVVLDPAITVSCTCANITGGTVTLNTGFFADDALNFTNQLGITGSYNGSTGVLTLSGTTTKANYTTALASITYSSISADPTNGGVAQPKTILWVVSNAGQLSAPVPITTINVTLPGQPSWAPAGSTVVVNGQTNQAWISGTGTVSLSSQLVVTRAAAETCQGTSTAYQAIANQGCTSDKGLAIWGAYTNYLQHSVDMSNAAWVAYTTGSGSLTIAGNSVVAPDGTTTAAKITATRTLAADNAQYIENGWQNGSTGTYAVGIWLKADGSGDVGKKVTLHTYDGATAREANFTLTATWTYYTASMTLTSCTSHSGSSCQFGLGFSSAAGSGNTSLSVNFDAWGGEVNDGPVTFPFIPTTTASVTSTADNIAVVTGSALETALTGAASTVFVNTYGAINASTPATILDSNGTIWLGQANSARLTTDLGSNLATSGSANWSLAQAPALARNASGRTMSLGRTSVWAKDTQATTVATPIHVGSTSGSSAFFNGYVQLIVAYDSRLADTAIGVSGAGLNYYFATAGSDAANCLTTGTACQTITKANTLNYVTNDTIHFNKGDTFTGCLNLTGGSNWNATTGAPGTVTSYGSGANPIITPNCTAGAAKIGAVNLTSVDGLIWNGVDVVGDAAGQAARGISIKNCDSVNAHGTITIENTRFTISHDGIDGDYGGGLFVDASCNGNAKKITHISVLNNTFDGATPSAPMDNGLTSYGYTTSIQYDAVQGNIFRNIGGKSGVNGAEGNGALINGVTDALVVTLNYSTHNGGNTVTCGGPVGLWTYNSSNITFQYNEASFQQPVSFTAGCDWAGFDADGLTNNITFDHNYSHDNYGPGILIFTNSGTHAIRWNISVDDATGIGSSVTTQSASGTVDVLFNTIYSDLTKNNHYNFAVIPACGAINLLVANNIFAQTVRALANVSANVFVGSTTSACTGSVIFKNNSHYVPAGQFFNIYLNVSRTSLAAWQAVIPGGDTNATSANPTWVGPVGGSITCYTSGTPVGPQPCPAGYVLGGGSTYKNTGLDVTAPPYSRSVGSTDYFGTTVPTGSGTGWPIGASN